MDALTEEIVLTGKIPAQMSDPELIAEWGKARMQVPLHLGDTVFANWYRSLVAEYKERIEGKL